MADEFCKYMHQFGPNNHLSTTSTWHSFPRTEFWINEAYPNIDYVDLHQYSFGFPDAALDTKDWSYKYGAKRPEGCNMPIIRGETGALGEDNDGGIWFHNLLWGSINSGGMLDQVFDSKYVYDNPSGGDLSVFIPPFNNFLEGIVLNNGAYIEASVITSDSDLRVWGQIDVIKKRSHLWMQNKRHTWRNIADGFAYGNVSGTVTVKGFQPNATYAVQWWNCYEIDKAQQILSTDQITADINGEIHLTVTNLATDIAVKIFPSGDENLMAIPGKIQAEKYKDGGAGSAYNDSTIGNSGNIYRNDDVDILSLETEGYYVTDITQGEWLAFDTEINLTGEYLLTARVRAPLGTNRSFTVTYKGSALGQPITFTGTGEWQEVIIPNINLQGGVGELRILMYSDDFDLDYIELSLSSNTNESPIVQAGANQSLTVTSSFAFPVNVTLNGLVTDDGLPQAQPSILWRQVSGPAEVLPENPSQANTALSIPKEGIYSFEILASDGELASSDLVTVTVLLAGENLLADPGFENDNQDSDWGGINPVLETVVNTEAHSGKKSLQIKHDNWQYVLQNIEITGGTTYDIRGWIKMTDAFAPGTTQGAAYFDDLEVVYAGANVQNQPPAISVPNTEKTISLAEAASITQILKSTVTDDGLPNPPARTTIEWSQISGPAQATIVDPNIHDTQVILPQVAGQYQFEIFVSDSEYQQSDFVTINVVDSIPDRLSMTNLTVNSGEEYEVLTNDMYAYYRAAEIQVQFTRTDGTWLKTFWSKRISSDQDWSQVNFRVTAPDTAGKLQFGIYAVDWKPPSPYIDSTELLFKNAPPLMGEPVVRTAQADADSTGDEFISFETNFDCGVYVAHDDRCINKPDWLLSFTDTGRDAVLENGDTLSIYGKNVSAGTVILGGNKRIEDTNNYHMYIFGIDNPIEEIVPLNQPPNVEIGDDRVVSLPASIQLNAMVNDDGLPEGSLLTYRWELIDGPDVVDIDNAFIETINATFPSVGEYRIRCLVSDGSSVQSDELSVTVLPSEDLHIYDSDVGSGLAYEIVPYGLVNGASQYIDHNSTFTSIPSELIGATYIRTAFYDNNYIKDKFLTFSINQNVAVYIAHSDSLTIKPDWLNEFEEQSDHLNSTVTWRDFTLYRKDFPRGEIVLGGNSSSSSTGQQMYTVIIVPLGYDGEINNPPLILKPDDQTIFLPQNSLTLTAQITDDNKPANSSLSVEWSLIRGPVPVNFSNPNAASTSVSFSEEGEYLFLIKHRFSRLAQPSNFSPKNFNVMQSI